MTLRTDGSADVELLHPAFEAALELLFADPRAKGMVVVSGVRSRSEQKYLYVNQGKPGFNTAANPDRVLGPRTYYGVTFTGKGSWHMQQETGFGYAVDLNYSSMGTAARALVDKEIPWIDKFGGNTKLWLAAPAPWGLVRTVSGEPWHVQPHPNARPLPIITQPSEEDDMTQEEHDMLVQALDNSKEALDIARRLRTELLGPNTDADPSALVPKIAKKVGA